MTTRYKAPTTPTLDKLAERHDERVSINGFVEWLNEQGIHLARYETPAGWRDPILFSIGEQVDALVMRFFGIDPNVVEQERRALLASVREDIREP